MTIFHTLHTISVLLIISSSHHLLKVTAFEIAQIDSSKSEPSFYLRQLQLLKLYTNLKCWKDDDLHELSDTFNPLQNLTLYKDPHLVQSYFEGLESGLWLGRDVPFANTANTTIEIKQFFLILLLIDDWDLFYKTSAYAIARVNVGIFFWALSAIVSSKYAHERFRTPPSYEVFPQLFAPKRLLYSFNNVNDEQFQTNLTNGAEDKLNYFKDDASLNAFHLAWHVDFPYWWNYDAYKIHKDRKGELFLYMHRQVLNRYRAERLSIGGLEDVHPLKIDEEIAVGYVPDVLNINFSEFPIRYNNTRLMDLPTQTVQSLRSQESTLRDAISKGVLVNDNGTQISLGNNYLGYDIVGATVESSEYSVSPKIYGSLHNRLHGFSSRVRDPSGSLMLPPGIIGHPETAIRDPVFFRIHSLIDEFYTLQSRNLKQYSEADVRLQGVDLTSVRIMREEDTGVPPPVMWPFEPPTPILETFFEDFTFDISNGIMSCNKTSSIQNPVATLKRHNHKPFKYYLKVHSHKMGKINATVRIYMSPLKGYDGKVYSDEKLYANMFEMDRFHVTLSKGDNNIIRSSKDSAVTIPDATPTKQLLKETREALASGKEGPDYENPKDYRHCGYPHHLLIPKGTPEGMRFKMFVIVTKDQKLSSSQKKKYPGLALCGVERGIFPDKETMGFPFDRKVNFGLNLPWFVHQSYKFLEIIVKHKT